LIGAAKGSQKINSIIFIRALLAISAEGTDKGRWHLLPFSVYWAGVLGGAPAGGVVPLG